MKLSFSTLGCPNWDLQTIVSSAREMGYDGVEIRGIQGELRADRISAFSEENRAETLKKFADAGLSLVAFGASASFHDPARLPESMLDGFAAVDLCAACGIPFVRVFGDAIEKAAEETEILERAAAGIRLLCDYARNRHVQILQEVHGNFNVAERLIRLHEMVGRENYGILWDVAHSDRVYGDAFLDFYQAIRPWIYHVHIKDLRRGAGLCPVGEGDIPLKKMIAQLENDGYQGFYSLEWEKKWHPDLAEPEIVFPAYVQWMRGL